MHNFRTMNKCFFFFLFKVPISAHTSNSPQNRVNFHSSGENNHVNYTKLAIKMTSTKPIIAFSWLLRSYKRRRFKSEWLAFVFACLLASCSARNNPPRFLIDGQTEIVIRLKEGPDTPVGKNMYIEIRCIIHRFTQPNTLLTYLHFLYNAHLSSTFF